MSSTATNVQTEYQFDIATDNTFLGNSKSGSYIYTGVTSDKWCIGDVPNGGYVLSVITDAVLQMFSKRYQSDPVSLNCFFFKKTLPGHHVIEIEELKMSKKGYCVVRACIKQQQDLKPLNSINDYNPQDWTTTVHGLFTMGNMDNEEGVTYFTRPATFPNEEHLEPFQYNFMGQFLESKLDTRVFPPSDDKEGIPEETHTMKFSDGRPVDFKSIPYWCDMFITPPFLLGPKILGGPVWCPTMQLEVQFKKKPTGHEIKAHFLARHIINGRFDVDGEVYNEQNELLALTRHQCLIVPWSRNSKKDRKAGAKI